jgi:release factor glutamine methyltransferase
VAAENVSVLIQSITQRLSTAGIEDAGIDARLLVRSAFGWSAVEQLGYLLDAPPSDHLTALEAMVVRRVDRQPLQYITGKVEFFRRQFSVNENVLIPRPETEQIVVQTVEFIRERKIGSPRVADICTGSGAIAISIALEMPAYEVHATDISPHALTIAQQNANDLGAELDFYEGNLLEPLSGEFDVIVANPPYILSGAMHGLQAEVGREPVLALDGGFDGLDVIRPLFAGIADMLKPAGSAAYIEIDPPIEDAVMRLALEKFPHAGISLLTDMAGLTRCISIERA